MAAPLSKDTGAMALASDLVTDSKLETIFKKGGDVVHVIQTAGTTPSQRKVPKKQKWRRTKDLGQGGFGVVWLENLVGGGKDEVQERAVKGMEKKHAKNYIRELHAIAKFSQDQFDTWFVKSFGWYELDEHVFISMEYLPHGDLSAYLDKSGPLPEEELQRITCQLLEGLECMHKHEFAHRDLKPQNVLIKEPGPEWWVKLSDFGISKRMESAAAEHTVAGTRSFMAPEILVQDGVLHSATFPRSKPYTNAVDIWALGALAFKALTGKQPFAKDLALYVDDKMPFPHELLQTYNVSQDGRNLLARLLAAKPEDRPSASEALADLWLAEQRVQPSKVSIESVRPTSTLTENSHSTLDYVRYLTRRDQKPASIESQTLGDTEASTLVSKTFDNVKAIAIDSFSNFSRRKSHAIQLDSHDNALGLTTLVEEPSIAASQPAASTLPADDGLQKDPSQSQDSFVDSQIATKSPMQTSARVESVKSSRSSEEERPSTNTTPSHVTPSVTLQSALDSKESLEESEEYFNRPIAVNDYTLSPGTTISEASPSQSVSETSPRAPSGHWTRAMPFSSLSVDNVSPVSPGWSKDPSIVQQKGCSLRPLSLPNDLTHTMDPDAFIIVIPGVGDPPVEIWSRDGVQNEPLVRDFTKHFMNIQVFALEHDLRVNGKAFRRWDQLRESSHTMMQLLHEHREQTGTMSIPMIFLGHGVGGLIIKDFFWNSSGPHHRGFPIRWYEDIVNNTVGIALLGTPHLTKANSTDAESILGVITRAPTSRKSEPLHRKLLDLKDTEYVRSLSEEFDKYIRQNAPRLPILSVWDGRESDAMRIEETRLTGRRWRAEKFVIVTYEMAKMGLPNEEMMVADCNHYQLCTHSNPEFRKKLIGFCHEKLLEAHGRKLGGPSSSSVALDNILGEGSNVPSPW